MATEHTDLESALDAAMNPKKREYCDLCREPTGRAGRGDDSIYVFVGGSDNDEVGPLCEPCAWKLTGGEVEPFYPNE